MARPPDSYPEDIRETFEYCENCGALTIGLDQHSCSPGGRAGNLTSEERARLREADDRPEDDVVLAAGGRSETGAYAYHELGADGEPPHAVSYQSGERRPTRSAAQDEGLYPCRRCSRLLDVTLGGEPDG